VWIIGAVVGGERQVKWVDRSTALTGRRHRRRNDDNETVTDQRLAIASYTAWPKTSR